MDFRTSTRQSFLSSDVKAWDTRYVHRSGNPAPIAVYENASSRRAFSSIAVAGSYLFVTCLNGRIYRFLTANPAAAPAVYSDPAFRLETFHSRCSVSPDAQLLACGSSSGAAFVWSVEHPEWPPYALRTELPDGVEVSRVQWNPGTDCELACASDASLVQLWSPVGGDPSPWLPELTRPIPATTDALSCEARLPLFEPASSNAGAFLRNLSDTPSRQRASLSLSPLPMPFHSVSAINASEYDEFVKENVQPASFATPIKFPTLSQASGGASPALKRHGKHRSQVQQFGSQLAQLPLHNRRHP